MRLTLKVGIRVKVESLKLKVESLGVYEVDIKLRYE
jgi:hypothetical protein